MWETEGGISLCHLTDHRVPRPTVNATSASVRLEDSFCFFNYPASTLIYVSSLILAREFSLLQRKISIFFQLTLRHISPSVTVWVLNKLTLENHVSKHYSSVKYQSANAQSSLFRRGFPRPSEWELWEEQQIRLDYFYISITEKCHECVKSPFKKKPYLCMVVFLQIPPQILLTTTKVYGIARLTSQMSWTFKEEISSTLSARSASQTSKKDPEVFSFTLNSGVFGATLVNLMETIASNEGALLVAP